jgi:hypothetical protein
MRVAAVCFLSHEGEVGITASYSGDTGFKSRRADGPTVTEVFREFAHSFQANAVRVP